MDSQESSQNSSDIFLDERNEFEFQSRCDDDDAAGFFTLDSDLNLDEFDALGLDEFEDEQEDIRLRLEDEDSREDDVMEYDREGFLYRQPIDDDFLDDELLLSEEGGQLEVEEEYPQGASGLSSQRFQSDHRNEQQRVPNLSPAEDTHSRTWSSFPFFDHHHSDNEPQIQIPSDSSNDSRHEVLRTIESLTLSIINQIVKQSNFLDMGVHHAFQRNIDSIDDATARSQLSQNQRTNGKQLDLGYNQLERSSRTDNRYPPEEEEIEISSPSSSLPPSPTPQAPRLRPLSTNVVQKPKPPTRLIGWCVTPRIKKPIMVQLVKRGYPQKAQVQTQTLGKHGIVGGDELDEDDEDEETDSEEGTAEERGRSQDLGLGFSVSSFAPPQSMAKKHIVFPRRSRRPYGGRELAAFLSLLSIIHRTLSKSTATVITKRDIYYQNPNLFGSQKIVDMLIDDLAATLGIYRFQLGVVASPKGLFSASPLFEIIKKDGGRFSASSSSQGTLIPPAEEIESLSFREEEDGNERSPDFVLIVEKEAVFRTLSQVKLGLDNVRFPTLGHGIIITGKGYPDVTTREFVCLLIDTFPSTPILTFVDGDPHGLEIYLVYKYGSASLAHENERLAAGPRLEWLGLKTSEFTSSPEEEEAGGEGLERFDHDGLLLKLAESDKKKAKKMMERNLPLDVWRELLHILQTDRKAEIEILSSLDFSSSEDSNLSIMEDAQLDGVVKYVATKIQYHLNHAHEDDQGLDPLLSSREEDGDVDVDVDVDEELAAADEEEELQEMMLLV